MSFKAMQWALAARPEPAPGASAEVQKHVLLHLANYSGDVDRESNEPTGVYSTYVSVPRLAADTLASERTVQRALRALEAQGLVRCEERARANGSRTTTLYVLGVPALHPPGDTMAPAPTEAEHDRGDTMAPPEPVLPNQSSEPVAVPATTSIVERRRDYLFEAVANVCGIDWNALTKSGLGPLARAVAELRAVEATPIEVHRRAAEYVARFNTPLTPMALTKHWASLGQPEPPHLTRSALHPMDVWLAHQYARREEEESGRPESSGAGTPSVRGLPGDQAPGAGDP